MLIRVDNDDWSCDTVIESAKGRMLVVLLLLAGQAILFPLYAQQPVNPEAGVFPNAGDFVHDSERYVGTRVETGGIVRTTNPLVISVQTMKGVHRITIIESKLSPAPGDKVRVFGVLTTPRTIRAIDGFKQPRTGRWYARIVSFLAGIWVLVRLIRHWTVDYSTLGIRPRESSYFPDGAIRRVLIGGGEDDA